MKIICIAGARPNFMKISPLMSAFTAQPQIDAMLVHTGQHYDERMSNLFFNQLDIPEPDINLGVEGGSHAVQTAEIMKAFEPIVLEHDPDAVLVVGDVNSTVACGLVTVKLGIKLIHVEAGLRSFDRSMPEEINRIITDTISDLLFCTEQSGVDNLLSEGKPQAKVFMVGNVMIDTLLRNRKKAGQTSILEDLGLALNSYALVTLHRPSNVDDRLIFSRIIDALEVIQRDMPLIFPVHPRTRKIMQIMGFEERVKAMPNLRLTEPMGYLEFLNLMSSARLVLTDSGGIQEETTILKVPCLTLRENTERPVTLEMGSNQLVGADTTNILRGYRKVMDEDLVDCNTPALWDGKAADRIAKIILNHSNH